MATTRTGTGSATETCCHRTSRRAGGPLDWSMDSINTWPRRPLATSWMRMEPAWRRSNCGPWSPPPLVRVSLFYYLPILFRFFSSVFVALEWTRLINYLGEEVKCAIVAGWSVESSGGVNIMWIIFKCKLVYRRNFAECETSGKLFRFMELLCCVVWA